LGASPRLKCLLTTVLLCGFLTLLYTNHSSVQMLERNLICKLLYLLAQILYREF
jgi:hypothetical protein